MSGKAITYQSGSASAGDNNAGGVLTMRAGDATGNVGSSIEFHVATKGSAGSDARTSAKAAEIDNTGSFVTVGDATVGGNLAVTGDLTVNGTTTTVNSTTVTVDDPIFTLGGDSATVANSKDKGIEFSYSGESSSAPEVAVSSNTATVLKDSHGYAVGSLVTIANSGVGNLDGTYTISSVPTAGSYTITTSGVADRANAQIAEAGTIIVSQKGFFGYDVSDEKFTFLTGANNSSETFEGTVGNVKFNEITSTGRTVVTDDNDATNISNGSIQTAGGLSVTKAIYNGGAATLASAEGIVTMGSATAATVSAAGIINVNNTTDATSTTNGSLQTDGGLSVVKDIVAGNDIKLLSDSAVLSLGLGGDATLTHDGTTGLTIAATPISIDSTGSLDLNSTTGDINFQDGGTTQLSLDLDGTAGEVIMQLKVDSDDFVFKQFDGTEVFRVEDNGDFDIAGGAGSSGVTISSAGQLTADGRVIVDDATDATSTTDGSLQTDGGLSVAKSAYIGTNTTVVGTINGTTINANTNSNNSLYIGNTPTNGTVEGASGNVSIGVGTVLDSVANTGINNTAVGRNAGNNITTGDNNTCIGFNATASSATAVNEITLGDGNIQFLRCADTSIASLSDERDKKDVIDLPWGLEFVDKLRPVQFTWDRRVLTKEDENHPKNGKKRAGFLAQDFQRAMPNDENEILDLVYECSPERIEAKYGNLIPMLTQAIKDLKAQNEALMARVEALENKN